MAVQITDENFNEYFEQALEEYGKAQENNSDVPLVTGDDVTGSDAQYYSMPLVKNQNGALGYAKVPLGGQNGFIKAVSDEVATTGMLQAITQEQFNQIFT